jgi:DNA ligase-1
LADYIVHKAIELEALSAKARLAMDNIHAWIISPKYDGCHAVFLFKDGQHYATFSRSGEKVMSMDHVGQDLLRVYPNLLSHGQVAITGEAWMVGKDFNVISGTFRRQYPQPDLMFVPFDYVSWEFRDDTFSGPNVDLASSVPYRHRLAALKNRDNRGWSVLNVQAYEVIGPLSGVLGEAEAQARFYKASTTGAYDGTILAQADGHYVAGSGKGGEFIKCKPLISFTVTVTGAVLDRGAKTGKNTAALKFMLDGIEQKVSTGLTQEQVDAIAEEFMTRPYGGTKGEWLGARIEVEAMGKTVNGFLREPRFKGIRIDA